MKSAISRKLLDIFAKKTTVVVITYEVRKYYIFYITYFKNSKCELEGVFNVHDNISAAVIRRNYQ